VYQEGWEIRAVPDLQPGEVARGRPVNDQFLLEAKEEEKDGKNGTERRGEEGKRCQHAPEV